MTRGRAALEHQLRAALDRLVPEGRIGLAVSGGPDSLALLLLAAAIRPGEIVAATVDHRLRLESAGEAASVANLCAERGVPHDVLPVTVAPGASVQAQAREARYRALGDWAQRQGLTAVATAHHADDQAETLLMRLARGSGVRGLAGIRESRFLAPGVALVRPLLLSRKSDLQAVVADAGIKPVDDPANRDDRHDRTRARVLLAATDWLDPIRLASSAAALADAEAALKDGFDAQLHERIATDAETQNVVLKPAGLNRLYRRWLLESGLALFDATSARGPEIDRLLNTLDSGRSATLRDVKFAVDGNGDWRLEVAPPRRS